MDIIDFTVAAYENILFEELKLKKEEYRIVAKKTGLGKGISIRTYDVESNLSIII